MTATPEGRAATAAMWDGADYARFGLRLSPAADALVESVAHAPAGPVLDVAAGTGSVAVAAARSGRHVDALDIAPGLVATGRGRTEREGLDVDWGVAAMDDVEPGARYAAALSSFGLIFAPDPVATLARLRATLLPGGLLGLTAWDPDGYMAGMARAMAALLPEPGRSAAQAWIRWGDGEEVRGWLTAADLHDVRLEHRTLPWRFPSVREATDFLFEASPGHAAAVRFSGDADGLRAAVSNHLLDFARLDHPHDPVAIGAAYVVVTARA